MRKITQIFVQQSIDARFTGPLWYRPPCFRSCPESYDGPAPAPRHPAPCPPPGDSPQDPALPFAFLCALFALVVRRDVHRADPLGARALDSLERRSAAGSVDADRTAHMGETVASRRQQAGRA